MKRKNHDRLIVEIGRGMPRPGMPRSYGTEAVLPASQLLPREAALFRVGDHISGLLLDIREDAMNGKGSGLTLSRTDPKLSSLLPLCSDIPFPHNDAGRSSIWKSLYEQQSPDHRQELRQDFYQTRPPAPPHERSA